MTGPLLLLLLQCHAGVRQCHLHSQREHCCSTNVLSSSNIRTIQLQGMLFVRHSPLGLAPQEPWHRSAKLLRFVSDDVWGSKGVCRVIIIIIIKLPN
jgi:hypothetical protein